MTDAAIPIVWTQPRPNVWACHLGTVRWAGHRGGYQAVPARPDLVPPGRPTVFSSVREAKAAIEALARAPPVADPPFRRSRGRG